MGDELSANVVTRISDHYHFRCSLHWIYIWQYKCIAWRSDRKIVLVILCAIVALIISIGLLGVSHII